MTILRIDQDLEDELGPEVEAPRIEVVTPETTAPPLHSQWARFRPQFAEAMEGGLHSIESLEKLIGQGKAYFLPGKNSAVVAEKVTYDGGVSALQVLWAVGDVDEILALAPGLEAIGRLVGCSEMLVEGRAGWTKILKAHGYSPWSVTLRKAL